MNTRINQVVGTALRRIRNDRDRTQAEVADAMGRPQSYVSKLESGNLSLKVHEAYGYAEALGVEPRVLFDDVACALRTSVGMRSENWLLVYRKLGNLPNQRSEESREEGTKGSRDVQDPGSQSDQLDSE